MIGERTAEEIKLAIGSAVTQPENMTYQVRGRDLISGLPKMIMVNSAEIQEALAEPVNSILEAIKVCLEKTPPELASDIMDRGIVIAGGGAFLKGMDTLISRETGIPVHLAEEPLNAVAVGAGKALENIETLRRLTIPNRRIG